MFPFNHVERYYNQKVDTFGLGVFRIVYAGILFLQALLLVHFRPLIFGDVFWPDLFLKSWLVVTVLLIIGFQTRLCAVLNYTLSVIIVANIKTYTYDFDKIMISMNFLMMFIPIHKSLSMDRRRGQGRGWSEQTSVLSYLVPVFIGLGLPYLDSVCHKIVSTNWMSGVGIWAPMVKTQMTWLPWMDYPIFLNNKFLVFKMNYLVLVFEMCFIFLFWFKKARVILAVLGVAMHLGILLAFPIPLFALGCASIYLLLLPPGFFRRLQPGSAEKENQSGRDPASGYDRRNVTWICIYLVICSGIQANYMINYALGKQYAMNPSKNGPDESHGENADKNRKAGNLNDRFLVWSTKILGIGSHRVFLDHHVNNNRFIWAVVYQKKDGSEVWLPVITPEGHPGQYLRDRIWSRWTAYVMGSNITLETRLKETANMIEFWCTESNNPCNDGHFILKQKRSVTSQSWQKDILSVQYRQPWIDIGLAIKDKDQVLFRSR